MADKKPGSFKPYYLIVLIILVLLFGMFFLQKQSTKQTSKSQPEITKTITPETALLVDVAVWYPSAPWSEPKKSSQTTFYGDLPGESIQATVTANEASIPPFEQRDTLKAKGFLPDNNLAADGPGSSSWGYKKTENGTSQVLTFSYRTQPSSTNPNEPIQFTCPCKVDITAFVSNPFSEK